MLTINVCEFEERFLNDFSTVGEGLSEKQRAIYMANACTRQIGNLIEEISLQLKIQGIDSDEEEVLHLSSLITKEYSDFKPKLTHCIYDLFEVCNDFLLEEWCCSAMKLGVAIGWFDETSYGINLTPSFSS